MERGRLWAAIDHDDFNENVFDVGFGILDEHIEIAILREHAGVHQFEFGPSAVPMAIFGDQGIVGKFRLRIFVQHLHIAVRGSRVEVEIIFLHILAMISLMSSKTEQALLQDMIAAVPHGEAETNHLMAVADASNTVFSPAVRARSGVVMRKIFPSRTVGAVVLAYGAPLPLG